jgi:maltose alpha-D-glucosyltransferase/alpha-amylase
MTTEQANSSLAYGDRLFLKLFRRLDRGTNPEVELGRFLTEAAHFPNSPQIAGSIDHHDRNGYPSTIAVLQELVRNEGDAWAYTLESIRRFYDTVLASRRTDRPSTEDIPSRDVAVATTTPLSRVARDLCGAYVESAALLGQRTAEMHIALASAHTNPEFALEPFSELYQRSLYQGMRGLARKTMRQLRGQIDELPAEVQNDARTLILLEQELVDQFGALIGRKMTGSRIRCHGDYHLGQILFTGKDFVIIDFEGLPYRRLSERRIKRSPLRDVASMLRSFDYAAQTVLLTHVASIVQKEELAVFGEWSSFWSQSVCTQFLTTYLTTVSRSDFATRDPREVQLLLEAFLLEKALTELSAELAHRPAWARVPLDGILRQLRAKY